MIAPGAPELSFWIATHPGAWSCTDERYTTLPGYWSDMTMLLLPCVVVGFVFDVVSVGAGTPLLPKTMMPITMRTMMTIMVTTHCHVLMPLSGCMIVRTD